MATNSPMPKAKTAHLIVREFDDETLAYDMGSHAATCLNEIARERSGAPSEADLIRLRTREGMAIARAKGKLRGKKPSHSDEQKKELRRMYNTGEYSDERDMREVLPVSRPTVCARTIGHRR